MHKFDIAIIGSGLGGLLCGSLLSKEGYNVCVLEKHHQIGGCLQTFSRKGYEFDTGIHYIGGLDEGQNLNKYFKYFGLMDELKLQKMDTDGFDIIGFQGKDYPLAMGYENFVDQLSKHFPKEINAIKLYGDKIQEICAAFPLYNVKSAESFEYDFKYLENGLTPFLQEITDDVALQNVLAGNNFLYAGQKEKSPIYMHALIQNSFIESSYRLVDGSKQMTDILSDNITKYGGQILTNANVVKIEIKDGKAEYLELENGEKIFADNIISNTHPAATLGMISKEHLRKTYRNRIMELDNTISCFVAYFSLKPDSFNYLNYNHYGFLKDTVWTASEYSHENWPGEFMFLTPPHSAQGKYAKTAVAMSYMSIEDVAKWKDSSIEKRGADYKEFKQQHAEKLIEHINQKYPGFKNSIADYYTSSPLTYRDYTSTKEGSLYGIQKDFNNPLATRITTKSKIPNLFFTGQNVNMHGVLGVTVGAVMTSAEFLGIDYILKKVNNA